MTSAEEKYSDIIDMPHHRSAKRQPMSLLDRAAQFAPFAALTGFDSQIDEAARYTGADVVMDESEQENIRLALSSAAELLSRGEDSPSVKISYFVRDSRKEGGELASASGKIKKIDAYKRRVIMADGTNIPIDDIRAFVI